MPNHFPLDKNLQAGQLYKFSDDFNFLDAEDRAWSRSMNLLRSKT